MLLRDEPERVKSSQLSRGEPVDAVDAALAADRDRRAAITRFEELRAEQNAFGKQVAQAPKDAKAALVAQAKDLADVSRRRSRRRHAPKRSRRRRSPASRTSCSRVCPRAGRTTSSRSARMASRPTSTSPRATISSSVSSSVRSTWSGARRSRQSLLLPHRRRRPARARDHEPRPAACARGRFIPMIPPTLVRPEVMQGTGFLVSTPPRCTAWRTKTSTSWGRARFRSRATTWARSSISRAAPSATRVGRPATAARPGRTGRTRAASSACTSSTSSRCSSTRRRRRPRPSTSVSSRCRSGCCKTWASPIASSTSPRETWAPARRASTTSRRGFPRRARTAS